ncbi:MAG: hypothetical protein A2Y61_07860 [Chloroflexi bacterium RBG_13_60_13]|jgi:hypothetical protein|nr:MAG: hypothetical protein A2Y61_07860 [Chloroflexi bacterium RBG_13_60_13]
MNGQAEKLCNAIDRLLLNTPRKTLVAEPEIRELLHVARLRRQAGRAMAALGSRGGDEAWRRLETSRQVR